MAKPKDSQALKTVLILCIAFSIYFLKSGERSALTIAVALGIAAIVSVKIAGWVHLLWMSLGKLLEMVMPKIILGIVFYVFLFPIALLSRLFSKKDPLKLRNSEDSTFTTNNREFDEQSFVNPW